MFSNQVKLFLLVCALIFSFKMVSDESVNQPESSINAKFNSWAKSYNKHYNSPSELAFRQKIFEQNLKKIEETNSQPGITYQLGETQYMDITTEEFIKTYLMEARQENEFSQDDEKTINDANDIDWRDKQAVTKVKNQGACGSCWAFATVAALESFSILKRKTQQLFSEQQLVDCTTSYGNHGCQGGEEQYAFKYVKDKGITLDTNYPYVARDQKCKIDGGAFKIAGHNHYNTCQGLQDALEIQPVDVGVDASSWSLYKSGIFTNCRKAINHAVLAVGYVNQKYWIIKNSWGSAWGEQGYIRLGWGDTCGVCQDTNIPI